MRAAEEIIAPSLLLRAYASGIFPMAENAADPRIQWIDPQRRGILPLDSFHVPRRLRRFMHHHPFDVRISTAFEEIVRLCAESASDRPQTWINETILRSYCALYALGFAHSVECWQDGVLVGGLYGVTLGGAFFGESMVSRAPNASKVALVFLVNRLREKGYSLLDTQFITEHLSQFGAIEVSRTDYHALLNVAIGQQNITFGDTPGTSDTTL